MIKRHLAGLVVGAVIAGGGAAAWAAAPETAATPTTPAPAGATAPASAAARPSQAEAQQCRAAAQAGQAPSAACQQLRAQAQQRRKAAPGPAAALARRTVHGDLVVRGKDGTFQNITVDRGTVQSKGDNALTVQRADGKTVTVKVDSATKYRGVSGFDAIQTGKPVGVVSEGGVARMVMQPAGGNKPNGSSVAS